MTDTRDSGDSKPVLKRVLALLVLALLLVLGSVFVAETKPCLTASYAGDGTAESPYEVSNAHQLQCVGQDTDAHYVQVSDIDASGTVSWNNGMGFVPIEGGDGGFNGTYDGAGYAITDLYISQPDEDPMTPDSLTEVAERELLGIEDPGERIALFGTVGLRGTVTNASLVNVDVEGREYVGTLVGLNYGTVTRSSATGNVSGDNWVGGLVGSNTVSERSGEATVSASYADVGVNGIVSVGGLVGENVVFGEQPEPVSPRITSSYATGNVTGVEETGGLVGSHNAGRIVESYATGRVSEAQETGGLVASGDGDVSDSYWDVNTTNRMDSAGGTGLTTDEMTGETARRNMGGFDFEETWNTVRDGYPELVRVPDQRRVGSVQNEDGDDGEAPTRRVTVIALRAREVPENATVVDCDDERIRRNETVAETLDEAVEDGDIADNTVTVGRGEDVIPDDLPFHDGSVYVECDGTVFELQSETLD